VALVVRDLDVFLGIGGLVRRMAGGDRDVALVVPKRLVACLGVVLGGRVDFRFWVADDDGATRDRVRLLERGGYRVLAVDATNVEATYRRLCVSPRVMIGGARLERHPDSERRRADAVRAEHPSYVVIEGAVPPGAVPLGIPCLHLSCDRRITDVAEVLDGALQLHSAGGPLLVVADILGLRCARYCHAANYAFPFRRVVHVV
jgi:hypothetical protein